MGNLNCARCCQGSELKQDIDLKISVMTNQINALSLNRETHSTEATNSLCKPVIKIQSFWRKSIAQLNYVKLKEKATKSEYFCDEEIFETVSNERVSGPGEFSYMYVTGTCYSGMWLGGFRHGQGECQWPDGSKYKGNWNFGYPFGQGVFVYKDGETFTGLWLHPYATIKNRSFLEDIIQGKRDGYGNFYSVWLNCKTNSQYKKLSHKKCKKKILSLFLEIQIKICQSKISIENSSNHSIPDTVGYIGSWEDEKREGFGTNLWENGDIYIGNWSNDMQNGWGKNIWADGSKYLGQYCNNIKEGVGEYTWEDGTFYIGEWKNNVIHGIGKYIWQDGKEYLGQWRQGLMSGFGMHQFPDGRKYEGGWKQGKKHGTGLTYTIQGDITKNMWTEGKIKR